jgi:hypothetical protein
MRESKQTHEPYLFPGGDHFFTKKWPLQEDAGDQTQGKYTLKQEQMPES